MQRTEWNSNINSPFIPWSVNPGTYILVYRSLVNPFLQYKSPIFGDVYFKWLVHIVLKVKGVFCCEHGRKIDRFLDPIISILYWQRSFIPSWIMMNEMGVSSNKGKYSSHLKFSRLHITWQLAVVVFVVRLVRFKIYI